MSGWRPSASAATVLSKTRIERLERHQTSVPGVARPWYSFGSSVRVVSIAAASGAPSISAPCMSQARPMMRPVRPPRCGGTEKAQKVKLRVGATIS